MDDYCHYMQVPNIGTKVVVYWDDTINIAEWLDHDEVKELATEGTWKVESYGVLSWVDDECVVVTARFAPSTTDGTPRYGLSERIPRRAITQVKILAC